jgi:PPK2 family polyphosphate:nucleotide phosphotransferase
MAPRRDIADHLAVSGRRFTLAKRDPRSTPACRDKAEAAARLAKNLERIDALQYNLYAEGRRSLLIVLQGMDTSGKDGLIRKVMTAFNPQACRVTSFKVPSSEEAAHDFLWRIHHAAPKKGETAIFNRSHYEDVLVVRVHNIVPREVWMRRFDEINAFERFLTGNGTHVLKFFLHISREEQRRRLLERLDEPQKHWKFSEADLSERRRWKDYQRAYADALTRCNTDHAPWYVVPADRKWYRDLAVSQIVADTLERMDPRPPKVSLDVKRLRAQLVKQ